MPDPADAPAPTAPPPDRGPAPGPAGPDFVAGAAALAWPGLGHVVRGRTRRGVLAMVGVLGLFLYGLFVGGIDAVDSREDRVWYMGAALVGPLAWGVDWAHQNLFKAYDHSGTVLRTGYPGEARDTSGPKPVWRTLTPEEIGAGMGPPNEKGLGRLNEIAMLSIAVAGMLNFIVLLDALLPTPEPRSRA